MEKKIIILLFIGLSMISFSEGLNFKNISYIQNSKGGDVSPLWFYSNKNGEYEKNKNSIGTISDIEYTKIIGKYTILTGIGAGINNKKKDKNELKKIYLEIEKEKLYISAGKKIYDYINLKSENSTGSLLAGNNSEGLPRLVIGSKGYIDVPYTKGYLKIGGNFSNGIFDDKSECGKPLLHEKELYGKVEINNKNSLYGGMSHSVIWGGEYSGKKINSSFKEFVKVIFAIKGNDSGIATEDENMIGDHKGIHEMGYIRKGDKIDTNIYYQHFFEDGSGLRFKNYRDMVIGCNMNFKERKSVKNIVTEYIYTKNQSGTGQHDISGGNDSYFSNYIYGTWSYNGMLIGNPLIVTENIGDSVKIIHSRIRAFHLGIAGDIAENTEYRCLLTYSENFGTCADIGTSIFYKGKKQLYSYFEIKEKELFNNEKLSGKIAIGYDDGEIFNMIGVMTQLEYRF